MLERQNAWAALDELICQTSVHQKYICVFTEAALTRPDEI